jgi:3-oxoacyl-[acyl-carrier-protein] synthase III
MPTNRFAQVTGWGMCVPEKAVSNDELTRTVDTSDEWIVSHTGIRSRHIADSKESTATLATRAAREALFVADLSPNQLDLVIVATATPEYVFPSTACLVQDALGAAHAGAFDLSAGCTGFIYALAMAAGQIQAGLAQHVMVIGAETLSRITDWTDRNTCVLFGDGAGAVVLSSCDVACGVSGVILGSDGSGGELLIVPAGGSHQPASLTTVSSGAHTIRMNGREVYRFATQVIAKATEEVTRRAGWQLSEVSLVVPHQANARIVESAIKRLNLPAEKFYMNIERYGNTSSASIPIALCEAINAGRVQAGDRLVLVGFGAGLTWGAIALEWGAPTPLPAQPWWRRQFATWRYLWAKLRSSGLRVARHVYGWTLGPEGRTDLRGRMRKRIDSWRRRLRNREE